MTTHVKLAYQDSLQDQTENVFVPEENMLIAISNVSHVSTTVPFVQVKPTVLYVPVDISYKTKNVSPDATSDITFQESYVKNVKTVVLTATEPDHASFVKLEDMLSTDYVISTVHQDQLLKLPT